MNYKGLLKKYEDDKYLINMISADDISRFGYSIGLNENSRILDLCCGYGTMLKIWNEVFCVSGIGVDRDATFVEICRSRLPNDCISLTCQDALQYVDGEKYEVVVCTELSTDLFTSFGEGIVFLERFLKPSGTLVFGRLFSKIPDPPKELIAFDGSMPTLSEIYSEVRQCGYLMTSMASGDTASWERYIMRESKLCLEKLRQNPNDVKCAAWLEKWHRIYYDFRRPYEGWALFGIKKITGDIYDNKTR